MERGFALKILVCIKQVPATNQVEVDEKTGVLKRDGAASKLNPYDLYALEAALRLREEAGGTVAALSMGPPQAKAALLEALHIGADTACLLSDRRFAGADVVATARTLAAGVRALGAFDLILCGKQTTDGDTAQVGPEMAEFLGLEHACYVQALHLVPGGIVAETNTGGGALVQRLPLPCLLTLEKDVNTPRLPSYVRSLTYLENRITVLSLADFADRDEKRYGLSGSPTQVERIFPPEVQTDRRRFEGDALAVADAAFDLLTARKLL